MKHNHVFDCDLAWDSVTASLLSSILCAFVISAIWMQLGSCQPGEQLEDTATDSVRSSRTLPMVPAAHAY